MFALPTPFIAERQIFETTPEGSMRSVWERCKVLGVGKDEDGEPVYVVEVYHNGTSSLSMEMDIKRLERGNPL